MVGSSRAPRCATICSRWCRTDIGCSSRSVGERGCGGGEAVGLCADALDLDGAQLRVIRTVIEVAGHTSFKPYSKSGAGRWTVSLPGWFVVSLRGHRETYPLGEAGLILANQVGGAHRRTLFRSRVWRPALVRAGLLSGVEPDGDKFRAEWVDGSGAAGSAMFRTEPAAVSHVARMQAGGCVITIFGIRTPRGSSTTARLVPAVPFGTL